MSQLIDGHTFVEVNSIIPVPVLFITTNINSGKILTLQVPAGPVYISFLSNFEENTIGTERFHIRRTRYFFKNQIWIHFLT
jgi:hypothetical protein